MKERVEIIYHSANGKSYVKGAIIDDNAKEVVNHLFLMLMRTIETEKETGKNYHFTGKKQVGK